MKTNSKSNPTLLIAIVVVVSLLVVAVIAFTFWRRCKKSKAKPNSLQRNHPSSSSSSSQQTNSRYSSLSSTRGLLGSIKEEEGSKEYLSDVADMQNGRSTGRTGSFEEEVRWATPNKLEDDQGYGNEIRRWDEGEEVVLGTVEYNYGQNPARGKGRGRGDEGLGRREELPPSFEDARRAGAGRGGVYEVLEDRKMLIPERG